MKPRNRTPKTHFKYASVSAFNGKLLSGPDSSCVYVLFELRRTLVAARSFASNFTKLNFCPNKKLQNYTVVLKNKENYSILAKLRVISDCIITANTVPVGNSLR